MYDTLADLPPMVGVLVGMRYDSLVDAVTPDPEVASRAKEVRKQMLEELRKQR